MIFVIDIGNTTVSVSAVEGEQVLRSGKTETNRTWDTAEYTRRLRPLLAGRAEGAILSSVVPQITHAVEQSVTAILGTAPLRVTLETKTGLSIPLPEPEKIGRDRLVDAAWAAQYYPLPAVTADLGTATTFNVILPGKIFAGGVICAGIQTGLTALSDRAAQLPRLALKHPDRVVGRDTAQCMLSGAVYGTAGLVDGVVAAIEQELGCPVTLLLTGGGAEYVTAHIRHPHIFDPDLTRKGLALLYHLNCPH